MFQAPSEELNKPRVQPGLSVSLAGAATAVPPTTFTQSEILSAILSHTALKKETTSLYRRVMKHPSIETRHFALTSLSEGFDPDPDRVNLRFEREATKLGTEALVSALQKSNLRAIDLNFLVVATCTGYVCPGLAARLIESAGLHPRIHYADLVGMGCGGAIPAMEQAVNFVRANPGSSAAVVSVEICSAAFFSNDEPDIVISNALFSDGAAAAVITSHTDTDTSPASKPSIKDFESIVVPAWREELRFRLENGRLRNVLGLDVPQHAGEALKNIIGTLLRNNVLVTEQIHHWMIHPGGHTVLNEVGRALNLSDDQLKGSRAVLKKHGNMSSASVLFVLEEIIASGTAQPGEWGILTAFGAGFSAFAALVRF